MVYAGQYVHPSSLICQQCFSMGEARRSPLADALLFNQAICAKDFAVGK